nr:T9SS type A sorting domain-containing protein [Chitinophaga filiformis]
MVAAAPEIEKTVDVPASSVVKVFPNPVVNNMSVQLQGLDVQATTYVQVVNIQGVLVKTIKVGNVDSYQQSIDLGGLTPGIYFVVIQNGGKVFREKVVKQ